MRSGLLSAIISQPPCEWGFGSGLLRGSAAPFSCVETLGSSSKRLEVLLHFPLHLQAGLRLYRRESCARVLRDAQLQTSHQGEAGSHVNLRGKHGRPSARRIFCCGFLPLGVKSRVLRVLFVPELFECPAVEILYALVEVAPLLIPRRALDLEIRQRRLDFWAYFTSL